MKTFDDFKAAFPTLYGSAGLFDFSPPEGWLDLVWELSVKLEPLGVQAHQVKTKFGGLRFYLDRGDDQAEALIREAESKSLETCERCGAPGERGQRGGPGGWVMTACKAHQPEDFVR